MNVGPAHLLAALDMLDTTTSYGDLLWTRSGIAAFERTDIDETGQQVATLTFTGCPGVPSTLAYELVGMTFGDIAGDEP